MGDFGERWVKFSKGDGNWDDFWGIDWAWSWFRSLGFRGLGFIVFLGFRFLCLRLRFRV